MLQSVELRAVFLWLLSATLLSGCGSPAPPKLDGSEAHMKVLGMLYGMYQSEHSGASPASEEQFIAFLEQAPANWEKIAPTPQQLLKSPRSAEPLTVVYGKSKPGETGDPWIAYEASSVDGNRYVVNARGVVKLVDDAEFSQLVPATK